MKIADDVELHPLLLEYLKRVHEELRANGELRSREALDGFYETFRQRFGPEALCAHNGESLLSLMHETTRDGMIYWLEFKADDEFPSIFGSIAGGSAPEIRVLSSPGDGGVDDRVAEGTADDHDRGSCRVGQSQSESARGCFGTPCDSPQR